MSFIRTNYIFILSQSTLKEVSYLIKLQKLNFSQKMMLLK